MNKFAICSGLFGLVGLSEFSAVLAFNAAYTQSRSYNPFIHKNILQRPFTVLKSATTNGETVDDESAPAPPSPMEQLAEIKNSLVRACESTAPDKDKIIQLAKELEEMGEQVGVGQGSSNSGLLGGEWSLLYASEDDTRSSPFFWAFRKTFPENSEQIFAITDAIPAPIKEVGPATQTISLKSNTLVSRVKVATLSGLATSIMTTRCTITNTQALDSIVVQVDSTKPEKSTVLERLGPLGSFLEENSQPFPSGTALEKVTPGGSSVVIETSFCDEGIRISRDGELNNGEVYIWVRTSFEEDSEV